MDGKMIAILIGAIGLVAALLMGADGTTVDHRTIWMTGGLSGLLFIGGVVSLFVPGKK
jgi:hypothetical protein